MKMSSDIDCIQSKFLLRKNEVTSSR